MNWPVAITVTVVAVVLLVLDRHQAMARTLSRCAARRAARRASRTAARVVASVTLVLDDRGHVMIDGTGVAAASAMFARVTNAPCPDEAIAATLGIDPQALDVLDTLRRSVAGQSVTGQHDERSDDEGT